MASILDSSKTGVRRTRLQCRCNLSYVSLCDYIDMLKVLDLLGESSEGEREDKYSVFQTTDRGREFLTRYNELLSYVQKDGLGMKLLDW